MKALLVLNVTSCYLISVVAFSRGISVCVCVWGGGNTSSEYNLNVFDHNDILSPSKRKYAHGIKHNISHSVKINFVIFAQFL